MERHARAAGAGSVRELDMNKRPLLAGVLALSALGVGYSAIAAPEAAPATVADEATQDKRETRLVMLKLPAMV